MTRDEYLEKCIRASVKLGKHLRFIDVRWSDSDLVIAGGIKYVPMKLIIGFDRKGMAIYSAQLSDVKTESVTYARLSDVMNVEDANAEQENANRQREGCRVSVI